MFRQRKKKFRSHNITATAIFQTLIPSHYQVGGKKQCFFFFFSLSPKTNINCDQIAQKTDNNVITGEKQSGYLNQDD